MSNAKAQSTDAPWLFVIRASSFVIRISSLIHHSSFGFRHFPRSPQRTARFCAGVLAIFDHVHAVHKNVFHANGILVWLLEGGAIGDCCRIKQDDISKHTFFQKSAMIEPKICRRERAQASNRFRQRDHFFVAHKPSQHPREISVGARMRIRF